MRLSIAVSTWRAEFSFSELLPQALESSQVSLSTAVPQNCLPSHCVCPRFAEARQVAGSIGFPETCPSPLSIHEYTHARLLACVHTHTHTPLIRRQLAALVLSSGLRWRVKSVEEALCSSQPPHCTFPCDLRKSWFLSSLSVRGAPARSVPLTSTYTLLV